MSSGTNPTPIPTPTPASWQTILNVVLGLIVAIVTGYNGHAIVNPVPPAPSPTPNVQPVPPAPIVDPVPDPTPVPPNPLTITDSSGNPITGQVSPGQMFFVSSTHSLLGIVSPIAKGNDSTNVSETKLVATLNAGSTLQVIQYSATGKPIVSTIGAAPLPPIQVLPDNGVNPQPVPVPVPVKTGKIFVAAVIDQTKLMSKPTGEMAVLNAIAAWNSIRENGGDWRHYSLTTAEAHGKKCVADAAASNPSGDSLVIRDLSTDALIAVVPFPQSVSDFRAIIAKYQGVAS